MDGIESEVEQDGLRRIAILNKRDRLVGKQVGGVSTIALQVGRFVLRDAIEPPIDGRVEAGIVRAVREVTNGTAILAVVDVPTAIVRQVSITLLLHGECRAVERGGIDVVCPASDVPLAAHVGLVASGFESLRHEVLAEVHASIIASGGADGVATGEQA